MRRPEVLAWHTSGSDLHYLSYYLSFYLSQAPHAFFVQERFPIERFSAGRDGAFRPVTGSARRAP